jgi:hypothetical protein
MVIAYLMHATRCTGLEAFATVSARRKVAFPNSGFWQQLGEYEMKVRPFLFTCFCLFLFFIM